MKHKLLGWVERISEMVKEPPTEPKYFCVSPKPVTDALKLGKKIRNQMCVLEESGVLDPGTLFVAKKQMQKIDLLESTGYRFLSSIEDVDSVLSDVYYAAKADVDRQDCVFTDIQKAGMVAFVSSHTHYFGDNRTVEEVLGKADMMIRHLRKVKLSRDWVNEQTAAKKELACFFEQELNRAGPLFDQTVNLHLQFTKIYSSVVDMHAELSSGNYGRFFTKLS